VRVHSATDYDSAVAASNILFGNSTNWQALTRTHCFRFLKGCLRSRFQGRS
jgi:hypothetical protein